MERRRKGRKEEGRKEARKDGEKIHSLLVTFIKPFGLLYLKR
jgi:hypothetical protein